MDEDDRLLSHQIQAVNRLAESFEDVYVITGRIGKYASPSNVHVTSSHWNQGKSLMNALRFLTIALPLVIKKKPISIFSHMTEVQSSLLAPFTKMRGVRHYLWYAHKHPSMYLKWSNLWVTGIVTSTPGSCPITSTKVFSIGQAVDPVAFDFIPKVANSLDNLIHIGRFDPAKNIESIIKTTVDFKKVNSGVSLTLIGEPSTSAASKAAKSIISKYDKEIRAGWLTFKNSIPRSEVNAELSKFDCFIHAYIGSLDKALIEATLVGLPVATVNPEYLKEFGTWSGHQNPSLSQELDAIGQKPFKDLSAALLERRRKCENNHSIGHWTKSLTEILS